MSLSDQMAAYGDPYYQPIPPDVSRKETRAQRQGRDGAVYVRQQKPRSLFMWLFIWGPVTLWIPTLYFQFSPRYFWKA